MAEGCQETDGVLPVLLAPLPRSERRSTFCAPLLVWEAGAFTGTIAERSEKRDVERTLPTMKRKTASETITERTMVKYRVVSALVGQTTWSNSFTDSRKNESILKKGEL
jgi:hypothetical protein